MSEFAVPEEAVAALDNAMQQDGFADGSAQPGVTQATEIFDPHNEGITQGDQTQNVATPSAEPQEPVAPAESEPVVEDSFTDRFDPNTLPPELLPAYKLLQADYTRKRQAEAEGIRQLQQYQGVDLDTAVQLLQRVQSPEGLLGFINEAGEYLTANGLAEFDTGAPAPTEPQSIPQSGADINQALAGLADDPEAAPLVAAVQAMQQRLDQFETSADQRLEAERQERQHLQILGELQRQENVIRTDNPHYSDQDIDSVYELASFFDGNLLRAQEAYEQQFARRLGVYLKAKESGPASIAPSQAMGTPVAEGELNFNPLDPREAHEAALEVLRMIEAQPD